MSKRKTYKPFHMGRIIALLLFLVAGYAQAQVRAELDSTKIKIGEELRYRLVVESDTTDLVQMPEGQTFLPLEVIESYPIDTSYNQQRQTLIKEYGLTQFDSGQYLIPRQRVVIGEKAFFTDSLLIEIEDVVVDTTKQKMFDIREKMDVGNRPASFGWLWILLAVAAIGFGIYWFLKRKKELEEAEELIPAYDEAIAALKALDDSPLSAQKGSKDYYSALTEIVKRYLDREVDATALESTSAELITRLQMHKDAGSFAFSDNMIRALDSILRRADLVKFAKQEIAQEIAAADRQEIEQVVNLTKEAIPEPTEEDLLEDLEYQEELRRKEIRKRWILGSLGGVAVILLAIVITANVMGYQNFKETFIGDATKEMLEEGQWYTSEYGNPLVILTTPEILYRVDMELPEGADAQIKDIEIFQLGEESDDLSVTVNVTEYNLAQQSDVKKLIDETLQIFEENGAQNLLIKDESFNTGKGLSGTRVFGSFNETKSNGKKGRKIKYEHYFFSQPGLLSQVRILYDGEDPYMEKVVKRITESIELEVNQGLPQIGGAQ